MACRMPEPDELERIENIRDSGEWPTGAWPGDVARALDADLQRLGALRDQHRIWQNPLLKAFAAGVLTREDLQYVFSQYCLYSKNFTRYLCALMANCDSDYFRARLTENIWEESGSSDVRVRHSELYRRFVCDGLGVDVDAIAFSASARLFTNEYLSYCVHSPPSAASAFLAHGTEGIVARLYQVFLVGLRKAGIAEEHLEFFRVHIACDDEHAATLQEIVASYASEPGWYESSARAIVHALDLRDRFFHALFQELRQRRTLSILDKIQARRSLADEHAGGLHHRASEAGEPLYSNVHEGLGIDFEVQRLPFRPEVLDPRIVRIAPGKNNEKHRHAHETVFYIIEGSGSVLVDDTSVAVATGDAVYVPRWSMHQTQNTGPEPMTILAVTDFGLTGKAFVGNYLKTARLKQPDSSRPSSARPDRGGAIAVGERRHGSG